MEKLIEKIESKTQEQILQELTDEFILHDAKIMKEITRHSKNPKVPRGTILTLMEYWLRDDPRLSIEWIRNLVKKEIKQTHTKSTI